MTVKLCSLLLVAALLLQAGCKKDDEINSALVELDLFTTELVNRIRAARNLPEGVDDAQRYLDSRKREIKSKAMMLARVRGIQVGDETEKRMIETVHRDQMTVSSMPSTHPYMDIYMSDPIFKTKLDKLVNDYLGLFQP